jgi:hypothetical protein
MIDMLEVDPRLVVLWAGKMIELPVDQLEADKARFLKEVAPEWDKIAAEREATYPVENMKN